MPTDNMALVLQLLLDESAKSKTVKGLKEVENAVAENEDAMDAFNKAMIEQQLNFNKEAEIKEEAAKKASGGLDAYARRQKALAENAKKYQEQTAAVEKKRADQRAQREAAAMALSAKAAQETSDRLEKERVEEELQAEAARRRQVAFKQEADLVKAQFEQEEKERRKKEQQEREADEKDKARAERRKQRRLELAKIEEAEARKRQIEMREAARLSRLASNVGRAGQALSIAGLAIAGGMYAAGNREANRQKELEQMTVETKKWLEAQQHLEASTQRMGRVAIEVILPYLEKAAALAERASKYLEAHPELAKTLFVAGAAALTLGTALTVASRGIRMVADIKYQAAQVANTIALEKNTAALTGKAATGLLGKLGLGGGSLAGGGATVAIAGTVAAILAVVAAGAVLGTVTYALIQKVFPKLNLPTVGKIAGGAANILGQQAEKVAVAGGMDEKEAQRKTLVFTYLIGRVFGAIKEGDPAWQSVVDGAKAANGALEGFGANLANEAKALNILVDLERENIQAEKQYAADRETILADAAAALKASDSNFVSTMNSITDTLYSTTQSIKNELAKNLASLATEFTDGNIQAQADYQKQRAELVSSGEQEIKRIREDSQKALEQLEKDHARNVLNLTNERDALGLVDEQNAYNEKKAEIKQNASEAAAQVRENMKEQLTEMARGYEEQRQERLAEYNKQKAETIAQAAEAQAQANAEAEAARAQAFATKKAEQDEIAKRRAEDLAALRKNFDQERNARAVAANAQIVELGGALQAEQMMRRQYYGAILADATEHMDALKRVQAGMSNLGGTASGTVGSRASGGYTDDGKYQMHRGEFVANPATTKMLEGMVGGRLTQQNLLSGMSGGSSVTWVDNRKFDADVSVATRNAITADTIAVLNKVIKKATR